jgi:DNA topoisomerase-3
MQLILAEKPSVARDLARVLGVRPTGRHAFEGRDRVISWCVGHLVELDEPAAYDARWKAWRLDTLPMIPERFKLRPVASARDQLQALEKLLRERRFVELVNACDAGREGELIFRYVYELAGCRLPVRRLWISSLTDEAVRRGFDNLRPGAEYDALGDAARCRSEADWLVGLNATRAVTVRHRTGPGSPLYSIGRVQTPTLALLVTRDKAIRAFVPRSYWEVKGTFSTTAGERFEALFTHERRTRLAVEADAQVLLERLRQHATSDDPQGPVVERVQRKTVHEPPPLLFDLTSLQRTANRRFGLSAARTLEVAQALYETHKVLTYPRTDSRYLTRDMADTLPRLFETLAARPEYAPFCRRLLEAGNEGRVNNRRVFDDAKVEDHHAIIPTAKPADWQRLNRDERNLYDLVARRFVGAFFPDAQFASAEAIVRVGPPEPEPEPDPARKLLAPDPAADPSKKPLSPENPDDTPLIETLPLPPDRFRARGRMRLVAGWQEVAGFGADDGDRPGKESALPPLTEGQRLDGQFLSTPGQTRPPPRYSEATLLSAMETAGRGIEDEELRRAMKDTGLGTPATRAATIETLIKRTFVARDGKTLHATATGAALIDALPVQSLASPELTGSWEARLARIARGQDRRDIFMRDIATYVADVVQAIRTTPANPAMSRTSPPDPPRTSPANPPRTSPPTPPHAKPVERALPRDRLPSPRASGRDRERGRRPLSCPACRQGTLLAGRRGWGCTRWREGCTFVIWFETAGKRLTDAQVRELLARGKTRKLKWPQPGGLTTGRLVLDLHADRTRGAARFQPED